MPLKPETLAVHAGREVAEPGAALGSGPVFTSAYHAGGVPGYARDGNPTWATFEAAVAALEGAADAVAFSTGMAAAAALVSALGPSPELVVSSRSHVEIRGLIAEGDARSRWADSTRADEFAAAASGADAAWVDAIANPTLEVADIGAIAEQLGGSPTRLIVDGTLATPILSQPLALGADAVLHSASKYLGGHSDLLLGVVATGDPGLALKLRERRTVLGSTPGVMEAWLALRGLRTLPLRIQRGQATARIIAERLSSSASVETVRYPGLGAMVSFDVVGGAEQADEVCRAVRLITHASSLGGVETLIERHAHWHDEPNVPPGLLRLSVGCEDPEDLWSDLAGALESVAPTPLQRPERPGIAAAS